jgi:hypothetical protein
VYSDEFLDIKEAEFMRHTLEREEAKKEQLRYRIWQLERELRWAVDELKPRFEDCYEEDAPERAHYNKAKALANGERS